MLEAGMLEGVQEAQGNVPWYHLEVEHFIVTATMVQQVQQPLHKRSTRLLLLEYLHR